MAPKKCCCCVPLRAWYDVSAILCIIILLAGIIFLCIKGVKGIYAPFISIFSYTVAIAVWIWSRCKPANLKLKKAYQYTYIVFTMIPVTSVILYLMILLGKYMKIAARYKYQF